MRLVGTPVFVLGVGVEGKQKGSTRGGVSEYS